MIKMNIPVIIPSYKNREQNIIKSISDGECLQDRKVIVYIYKDEYDLYKDYKNIDLRLLDVECRSIIRKRHYIINDLIKRNEDFDYFWFIDDDVSVDKNKYCINKIDENGNYYREKRNINIDEMLKILEEKFNPLTDAIIGPTMSDVACTHAIPDYLYKYASTFCCVLLNFKLMKELNINYPDDDLINEDHFLGCIFNKAGYYTRIYPAVLAKFIYKWGDKNSVGSESRLKTNIRHFNLYLFFGDAVRLYVKNNINNTFKETEIFWKNKKTQLVKNNYIKFDKKLVSLINKFLSDTNNEDTDKELLNYLLNNKTRTDQE